MKTAIGTLNFLTEHEMMVPVTCSQSLERLAMKYQMVSQMEKKKIKTTCLA